MSCNKLRKSLYKTFRCNYIGHKKITHNPLPFKYNSEFFIVPGISHNYMDFDLVLVVVDNVSSLPDVVDCPVVHVVRQSRAIL
jgi:hypothetical protein